MYTNNNWRPENWKELYTVESEKYGVLTKDDWHIWREIGADSMLESLYNISSGKVFWLDKADDGHILIYTNNKRSEIDDV